MSRLRALWAGDLPLGEAFWTYAVSIGLTVNLVTSLLFLALIAPIQDEVANELKAADLLKIVRSHVK